MLAGNDATPSRDAAPPEDILDLTEFDGRAGGRRGELPDHRRPARRGVRRPARRTRNRRAWSTTRAIQSAQPAAFDRTLISSSTSAAVDSAFNSLAHTVLVQNARTLEDLVREMLRPMLKSWLDDNLPSMVERIVRAEIERVSRGRG